MLMTREGALIKYPFAKIPENAIYIVPSIDYHDKLYWTDVIGGGVFREGYINKVEPENFDAIESVKLDNEIVNEQQTCRI